MNDLESQPTATELIADYLPLDLAEALAIDRVADAYRCPHCGENAVDRLANDDGHVVCESCGCEYDREPEA